MSEPGREWAMLQEWLERERNRNPSLWYTLTYTYTTDSTAPEIAPDSTTYSHGFEDGWEARGAADGKPKS